MNNQYLILISTREYQEFFQYHVDNGATHEEAEALALADVKAALA